MKLQESWRHRLFAVGTWLLGVLFVVAALMKSLSFDAFVAQLGRYHLISAQLHEPAALGIIFLEASLGVCVLLGWQARRAVWCMLLLLLLFAGATLLRWNALQGTDCNCFGRLSEGGPSSIIFQDAALSCAALLLLAAGRGMAPLRRHRLRLAAGIPVIAMAVIVAQPAPAVYSLRQAGQTGDEVRVFLSAGCGKCQKSLPRIQELARASGLPPLKVYIGGDNERQVAAFVRAPGPFPEYTSLTIRQLGELVSRVPTVQLIRNGKVQDEWEAEIPSVAEVSRQMGGPAGGPL